MSIFFLFLSQCIIKFQNDFACLLEVGEDRGGTVVKVLCNKSEGPWVDPRWCHWNFLIDVRSFRSHYGPGVDSASNINEYQEYFLG